MTFAPGSQYRYNQTDYMLLGLLIEKVSGLSYQRFCQTVALMNDKIISRENLKVLLTPLRLEDGTLSEIPPSPYYPWRGEAVGGLLLVPDALHPAAGSTGGPYAAFIFYPRDKLSVVVLTNTQESNPDWIVGDVSRKYLAPSDGGK
jgi:CubicO group peptidase (beta-lactamase class C family)